MGRHSLSQWSKKWLHPQSTTPPKASYPQPAAAQATPSKQASSHTSSHPVQTPKHHTGSAKHIQSQKKDYWQLAIDQLQAENPAVIEQITAIQQAAQQSGNGDFTTQLLLVTKRRQDELEGKKWSLRVGQRDVVVRDQLETVLKVVTSFRDLLRAVGQVDPVNAGVPLAGLCVLMQVVTNDMEQYSAIVTGVEQIATIITRYKHIEVLYQSRAETTLTRSFEARLIILYQHIIRYQIAAACYYQRNTMLRFLRSIPRLDDLSQIMSIIQREDNVCKDISSVFSSQDAVARHDELLQRLDQFEQKLGVYTNYNTNHTVALVHWNITRTTNSLFTGRENILTELGGLAKTALADPNPIQQCRVVITGMGGQGKSELCLQLANRVRNLCWGVFWIDVSTVTSAEVGFADVARRLKIADITVASATAGLASANQPWLLILDNADDPSIQYQDFIPPSSLGVVVLTSRNIDCKQYATTKYIALDGLGDAEAQDLVLRAAQIPLNEYHDHKVAAQEVSALLRSHPLALIQAGAYVSRGHCSLSDYPSVYEQQKKRLLSFRPTQGRSRYGDVYTTFEASAAALQASDSPTARDALQLLDMLAMVAQNRLSLWIFPSSWYVAQSLMTRDASYEDGTERPDDGDLNVLKAWHIAKLPQLIDIHKEEWDSFELMEAVNLLKAFSLISTDVADGVVNISMHPLIHVWAKTRQDEQQQQRSWLSTACTIVLAVNHRLRLLKDEQRLLPHLDALLSPSLTQMFASGPKVMIARLLQSLCWELHRLREDVKLNTLLQDIFAYLNVDPTIVEAEYLSFYYVAGQNWSFYGHAYKAIPILEQVIKIYSLTKSEDDATLTAAEHALAFAYRMNDQPWLSIPVLEKVVERETHSLPENSLERLVSRMELAIAYRKNGQISLALPLAENAVEISKTFLQYDNTSLLEMQHELALICKDDGQIDRAMSILEDTVKHKTKVLADHHPDRLVSERALADLYSSSPKRLPDAIILLEHLVEIEDQLSAMDSGLRLWSRYGLVKAYLKSMQGYKAAPVIEWLIRSQDLAEDHSERLLLQQELAEAYRQMGRTSEAADLLRKTLKVRQTINQANYGPSLKELESDLAQLSISEKRSRGAR